MHAFIRSLDLSATLLWSIAFFGTLKTFQSFHEESGGAETQEGLLESENAASVFLSLREKLASGWILENHDLALVSKLKAPWGILGSESIEKIRQEGAQLDPTLQRLQSAAARHAELLKNSQSKVAQTRMQAKVAFFMVPFVSWVLYQLLPGIDHEWELWLGASLAATLLTWGASIRMDQMAETARWARLVGHERGWMLDVQIFLERLAALIRSGKTPDQAWLTAVSLMPWVLRQSWGSDFWSEDTTLSPQSKSHPSLRSYLLSFGREMKEMLRFACFDGRGVLERLDHYSDNVKKEIQFYQNTEIEKLPTKALKPLFLGVAPAILGLFGVGLFLSLKSQGLW